MIISYDYTDNQPLSEIVTVPTNEMALKPIYKQGQPINAAKQMMSNLPGITV